MFRPLITTLAESQSRFWLPVGLKLKELGHEPAFLSFDDRSSEMLRSSGFKVFNATQTNGAPRGDDPIVDSLFTRFGIDQINFWTSHERLAFGRRDSVEMRGKLALSIMAADRACAEWLNGGPAVMVQELGGFLSVIGSFHAARANKMHNWFIEPSFFRGRMFFVEDSFAAIKILFSGDPCEIPLGLNEYLEETVKTSAIVVPEKDRHRYTTARKKIFNWRNLQRLIQKFFDKYALGKKQEFCYIGNHIESHVEMLINSHRLKSHFTHLDRLGRFIYYPLHVPGDMALTLRSPHLLDQLALIDYICRCAPSTHLVVIKEHPALMGAVDAKRLIELLGRFDNLALLPPTTNNYQVLSRADVVVSINSKSGAEAGLLGKPVLVLGDAFYSESSFATRVEGIQDLPKKLIHSLSRERKPIPLSSVHRCFANIWNNTYPGELYFTDPKNVETFVQSMLAGMYVVEKPR